MTNPPPAIREAAHWLAQSTRYCCRCLSDRPAAGGVNRGGMFTCASCRVILEALQRGGHAPPLGA